MPKKKQIQQHYIVLQAFDTEELKTNAHYDFTVQIDKRLCIRSPLFYQSKELSKHQKVCNGCNCMRA